MIFFPFTERAAPFPRGSAQDAAARPTHKAAASVTPQMLDEARLRCDSAAYGALWLVEELLDASQIPGPKIEYAEALLRTHCEAHNEMQAITDALHDSPSQPRPPYWFACLLIFCVVWVVGGVAVILARYL